MKVYFVAASNDGCGFYRTYLPYKFLSSLFTKTEINIDWFDQPNTYSDKLLDQKRQKRLLEFADAADIIIMQRPESPQALAEMHRLRTKTLKKVVYENDDLMWDIHPDNPMSLIPRNREIIELMIQGAHLVTTTTPTLKEHYRQYNKNVRVLPNSLDFSFFPEAVENDTGNLRLLLSGSVIFKENSKPFFKTMQEIIKRYPKVTFVVQGLPPKEELEAKRKEYPDAVAKLMKQYYTWDSLPAENVEIYPHTPVALYPAYTSRLKVDMALIPREDDAFNKAKSNLKYLEMAALRIPVVAQSFKYQDSPYERDIENGQNGYLANTTDEWLSAIEQLQTQKRKAIIENAYNYVRANYDIKKNIGLWKEAYQELLTGSR